MDAYMRDTSYISSPRINLSIYHAWWCIDPYDGKAYAGINAVTYDNNLDFISDAPTAASMLANISKIYFI